MKKALLLFAILFSAVTFAQVPQGISYQAIALNGSGNPIANGNIGLRLSVLDNSASGTVVYTETHTKTTNAQGLFNAVIGQGTATFGTFAAINWKANFKFLKVEMDAAGGTVYALVGTTQLISVPYALAAKSLVLGAGEGITLTSPNGTPYQVAVNDAGQLSLPASGSAATYPTNLYMYGSFNTYNPTTSLLMPHTGSGMYFEHQGYKYLTAGTTFKFLSGNVAGASVYGEGPSLELVLNGSDFAVPSTGFYRIAISNYIMGGDGTPALGLTSMSPKAIVFGNPTQSLNPTYNPGTNTFTFIANGITSENQFHFQYPTYLSNEAAFGDNLGDGSIEQEGTPIVFPGANATPKNYRINLILNFNGSATYTVTQI